MPTIVKPTPPWVVSSRAPLDRCLREKLDVSWNQARQLVTTGKVSVNDTLWTNPVKLVPQGATITLRMNAEAPTKRHQKDMSEGLFVHFDPLIAVIRKPAGIATIPHPDEPSRELTLDAIVREALARRDRIRGRAPLGVVHRLDRGTTGLMVFTRTLAAKKHLSKQFRDHTIERKYQALVQGRFEGSRTIDTIFTPDRGDGRRGSRRDRGPGQRAVTHVRELEQLAGATLVECELETGRTHQIRIHLAEAGHPLLGETVYGHGHTTQLERAARVMLHAKSLGFTHPGTEAWVQWDEPLPEDFLTLLSRLRSS